MQKIILISLFLLGGCLPKKIVPDLNLLKLQADIENKFNTKIDKLAELNLKFQTDLNAKLELNNKMIAGFNNQINETKTTAGRDVTETTITTNDTELMKYITKGLIGLCVTLVTTMGWCLKTLIRKEKEKKFFKEKTMIGIQNIDDLKKLKRSLKKNMKD